MNENGWDRVVEKIEDSWTYMGYANLILILLLLGVAIGKRASSFSRGPNWEPYDDSDFEVVDNA